MIAQEPVDTCGAPLFLPASLATQRDAIWTEARQQAVIDALVTHRVAVEIDGDLQLPGEAFVRQAKAAGAKFTLGRCAVDTPAGDYFLARSRIAAPASRAAAFGSVRATAHPRAPSYWRASARLA